ncbi:hypothetical protein HPP92_003429 [Vanilla planifolia]|uniref:Growth-regulating factor n=1 Tax=Vanilla planifolia TaxID=51239 RepID=A0A835S7G0_VANPL|nr:hypothetical protein HPP92_003429 [Vanilla planifolia]
MNSTAAAAGSGLRCRPPFTASQWEELEHQALIFKYLVAGIPVPPDLLLPIQRSYESMAARFYSHPSLGYCSYYGKKMDPEPGRCRRTDGKKWRCSKDAYPDSKYCERHMHRGRNRSRKHVESQQALPTSQPSSSTATPLALSAAGNSTSGTSGVAAAVDGGGFHDLQFHSISSHAFSGSATADGISTSNTKDFRYLHGSKPERDKGSFFSDLSGNTRAFSTHTSLDNSSWSLMPSPIASFQISKDSEDSFIHSNFLQLQPMQGLGQVATSSLHNHHHHHSFSGNDFSSFESPTNSAQALRPFFEEWPRTRDSWSDLEDGRSKHNSFSTTQLSISIPMASSDFSITSSRSPNDE